MHLMVCHCTSSEELEQIPIFLLPVDLLTNAMLMGTQSFEIKSVKLIGLSVYTMNDGTFDTVVWLS